jgi:O-antigen biosynthesis protein WbqP
MQEQLIFARRRLGVDKLRPGITGVAQVQGIDMSEPERLAVVDATYQPSLSEDIRLILQTVGGAGRGDRVGG